MPKKLLWIVLALAMAAQAAPFDPAGPLPSGLKPDQLQSHVAHLAADLISRYHYKAMPLDDAMSEKIFNNYLKSLDSEKLYFVRADIDQLTSVRAWLDDAIIDEDLHIPFAIFNLYAQRVSERVAYARRLLRDGFDFSQKESYQYAREKEIWPESDVEMRNIWRKRVKNDWLRLKLAGKEDKDIVATLDKRYEAMLTRLSRLKSEDAFQTFMNAYTMAIEPHTTYKGPRAAEDAGISMTLSLVGIGTVLTEKDDHITIREIVPGGPSALSGRLKVGDRIVGVAQGEGSAMTNVRGWRMDDIVALIRGSADSVVVLDVLPAEAGPDGKRELIPLIRKKIALADQHARKTILAVTEGNATRHIGVISLPSFYHDFQAQTIGDRDFNSAARDVARLLGELNADKVDGVLIDLRNNGGGSLAEAIELTGMFIGKGPVVQQLDASNAVTVERDARSDPVWAGPLGVLINRASASASEIFAAAIQDYGRGLVIGETSYGKGTVQAVISLDRVANGNAPKLGELRLTVAQFFRISGDSTQLRGVRPDILLPSAADTERSGESSFDNPLPWQRINAADYSPAGDLKARLPILLRRHEARMKVDKDFKALKEDIAEFKFQRTKQVVSLNEAERRLEREALRARLTTRKAQRDAAGGSTADVAGQPSAPEKITELLDDGLQADERNLANELAAESAHKVAKDIFLSEAVHILGDEVGLVRPVVRLASRVKPVPAPMADQKSGTDAVGNAFR